MPITVEKLSRHLGLTFQGRGDIIIDSIASFEQANANQLCFLLKAGKIINSTSSAVVITSNCVAEQLSAAAIIISANPQLSFAQAIPLIVRQDKPVAGVDRSAVVADSAMIHHTASILPNAVIEAGAIIGENVVIGPNSFIGENSQVSQDTEIDANVTIYANTCIGHDCRIHSGTVIGSPGFGIVSDGLKWHRFPQLGRVVIGDRVDIGANCCIDRGAIDDTVIGTGVKLDNLIQVAHNVQIGDNTVIAACTGIAGSAVIGKNCQIGGRASIQGHISIADNVVITTCTFVNKSIRKPGVYSSSIAMQENAAWLKNHARLHHLDTLSRRVTKLENEQDKDIT